MSTMQALTYHPQRQQWQRRELPIPQPHEHDVLVRIIACGLNPVDAKIRLWQGIAPDMNENWVAGLDIAGEV